MASSCPCFPLPDVSSHPTPSRPAPVPSAAPPPGRSLEQGQAQAGGCAPGISPSFQPLGVGHLLRWSVTSSCALSPRVPGRKSSRAWACGTRAGWLIPSLGRPQGLAAQWGGGDGVAAETKELWIHHFKAVRSFPAGLSRWKHLLTFSRPRPITLLPTQRRALASILPSRWKWKKKSCFETVLPSLAVYTCLPQGSGQSGFQWGLPMEGRQSHGVLTASLGFWEELDHLVRARWSGSGALAPCPASPFRLR